LNVSNQPEWVPVRVVASSLDGVVRVDNPPHASSSSTTLAEGDRVVAHSQKPVQAGMRLKVVDALVPGGAGSAQAAKAGAGAGSSAGAPAGVAK
jgi:hypothetical protein